MFDPMAELNGEEETGDDATAQQPPAQQPPAHQGGGHGGGGGGGKFADDLHSVTIHAKQRTFYIDLKQSSHGKFFKVSEKSRGGQKTTIMFDAEDLEKFIEAFTEMKDHI